MNKGIRSIHGIDNPTSPRGPDLFAFLFSENAILRKSSLDVGAQASFGFAIGDRHKRAISLTFGNKRSFEVAAGNISRFARQSHREIQEVFEFRPVGDHALPFLPR